MDVHLLPLVVRKVFGLDSDTIPNVSDATVSKASKSYRFVFIAIRRVLHLKMVTQCAMLEDFGIFLVLADKVG
jgi:hypothetical protein